MKQIIISVGREFGSGGHIVAQKLAEHYDIPIFNKELLEEMARKEGYSEKALEKYDEKPVNFGFMPLPYAGGNIPIEQEIAMKQFEFIKNKADAGESFVIVGRCADYILRDREDCLKVFLYADEETKENRIQEIYGEAGLKLKNRVKDMDVRRGLNYKYFTGQDWGKAQNYGLALNRGSLGIEKCAQLIVDAASEE